jgi:hypothetical protein
MSIAMQLCPSKPLLLDQSGLYNAVWYLFRRLSCWLLVQQIMLVQSWHFYVGVDAVE